MPKYEYKIIYRPPSGIALMPWVSKAVKEELGYGSTERILTNVLQKSP